MSLSDLAEAAGYPYASFVPIAFETMFEHGRYLRLMNMVSFEGAPSVGEALDELERCARADPHPCDAARALFEDPNWRAHVIASTALAMGLARPRLCLAAWKRLDEGSWASPQLVAALSLADRRFVDEARSRIEMCRIDDAKKFGALVAALDRLDGTEGERPRSHWLVTAVNAMHARAPAVVTERGELDIGSQVAKRWLARVLVEPGLEDRLVDLC